MSYLLVTPELCINEYLYDIKTGAVKFLSRADIEKFESDGAVLSKIDVELRSSILAKLVMTNNSIELYKDDYARFDIAYNIRQSAWELFITPLKKFHVNVSNGGSIRKDRFSWDFYSDMFGVNGASSLVPAYYAEALLIDEKNKVMEIKRIINKTEFAVVSGYTFTLEFGLGDLVRNYKSVL